MSFPPSSKPPLFILVKSPYRFGLNGLLNPPTRFMYCLYVVFFSFLTAYISFPGTFVFFVLRNRVNPRAFFIARSSSSSSAGSSRDIAVDVGLFVVAEEGAGGLAEVLLGTDEEVGGGLAADVARGTFGAAAFF